MSNRGTLEWRAAAGGMATVQSAQRGWIRLTAQSQAIRRTSMIMDMNFIVERYSFNGPCGSGNGGEVNLFCGMGEAIAFADELVE